METLSGNNTLHDTVGIFYSKVTPKDELVTQNSSISDTPTALVPKTRRRKFENPVRDIEPYRKKPRMTEDILNLNDPRRIQPTTNLDVYRK